MEINIEKKIKVTLISQQRGMRKCIRSMEKAAGKVIPILRTCDDNNRQCVLYKYRDCSKNCSRL